MLLNLGSWLQLFTLCVLAFAVAFLGLEWSGAITVYDEIAELPISAVDNEWGAGTSLRFRDASDELDWRGAALGGFGFSDEQKPLWAALFAALDPGMVPLDHYDLVGDLWMWTWMFISGVILVNLLIAMFTETCECLCIELVTGP